MEGLISVQMGREKYSKDGKTTIEVIKNIYSAPEGYVKEEIIIKRTLIKPGSTKTQMQEQLA